ncbi:nardilysin-like, partial [Trifolium medium]|nr:nardilysin-like [Trifolium medium]
MVSSQSYLRFVGPPAIRFRLSCHPPFSFSQSWVSVLKSPTLVERWFEHEFISRDNRHLAAAAMCVGIGSFSDPNEAQGLAHFL